MTSSQDNQPLHLGQAISATADEGNISVVFSVQFTRSKEINADEIVFAMPKDQALKFANKIFEAVSVLDERMNRS